MWMLVAGKRTAYFRIPAKDVLYSEVDIKKGKLCAKHTTLLLKVFLVLFVTLGWLLSIDIIQQVPAHKVPFTLTLLC